MFVKKETLLLINLVSNSRPDQVKLVGRLVIDLADIINDIYLKKQSYSLQFCSVNASVYLSGTMI